MTVDETGSSTIILLPSCDVEGNCFVGEIAVESDADFVILNPEHGLTQVDVPENRLINPVIIELDESLITNLLIIRKPPKLKDQIEVEKTKIVSNVLDLDFLSLRI